jgi:hypothetical protein
MVAFKVAFVGTHAEFVGMHMLTGGDCFLSKTNKLGAASHGLTGNYGSNCHEDTGAINALSAMPSADWPLKPCVRAVSTRHWGEVE